MNAVLNVLACLVLVIGAGGRFTVAWQQHGGHPYAGSSMYDNVFLGFVNIAIGLGFLALAKLD